MKTVDIFYDKSRFVRPLAIGLALCSVIGVSLTADNITVGAFYSGLIILAPCIICTTSYLKSFIKSSPPLTISEDGIIDVRVFDEVIEWDSIQDISLSISKKYPSIILSVSDRIESKRKFSLGKLIHNFETKLNGKQKFIPITTFGLRISVQELFNLIQRYRKYGTSS